MNFIYGIGIRIYTLLVLIVSPFNKKAKEMIIGRRGLLKRIKKEVNRDDNLIWIHAASLGEFEQGRPLIEKIKQSHPEYKIMLTFFSPSGYNLRKNYELADYVYYLPFDYKWSAKKFIKYTNPKIVFFIKYEYWVNFLTELERKSIPTYVVSAIFRDDQIFFNKYIGWWFRNLLNKFTQIYVQNSDSKTLLNKYNIDRVTLSGDTRFDRVYEIATKAEELPIIENFKSDKRLIVAGSTWPKDEDFFVDYINKSSSKIKFIIAPHEIEVKRVNKLLNTIDKSVIKYSEIEGKDLSTYDVLIIDNIGLLSRLYRYADFGYIGGGFGVGIHNILEAATFGLPIVFGPNYLKFKEANDLIYRGSAFSIESQNELNETFSKLLNDDVLLERLSNVSADYVNESRGSTELIINGSIGK